MSSDTPTPRTPAQCFELARTVLADLEALEARLLRFSGGTQDYIALLRSWLDGARSAELDPALLKRLVELEPSVLARVAMRARESAHYVAGPVSEWIDWLARSRETTNYTYDLTPGNLDQLTWFAALVSGVRHEAAKAYVDELLGDEGLASHIARVTSTSERKLISDPVARYSRRIGWYAIVRARRPKVVVETGVDKGLGTCVLAAALLRNREEGHPGRLVGLDIVPTAGELVQGAYREVTDLVYGDALATLAGFAEPIDVFIHDSDHRAEYERAEFEAAAPHLAPKSVVLSDNAHATGELSEFAKKSGRRFAFFREQPAAHFYPGGGIGAAF